MVCLTCGEGFAPRSRYAVVKYCSEECRQAGRPRYSRECQVCGQAFETKSSTAKYCSRGCGECASNARERAARAEARNRSQVPIGRYVYIWRDGEIPFYVGKGSGDRAYRRHRLSDGSSAACEKARACCKDFNVLIVRENLTAEGAVLVEASCQSLLSEMGFHMRNQAGPVSRQEQPPLELHTEFA